MVRNISNKELPKLAKKLNQRMVEFYRQGKTDDSEYKALQNALSQNPLARQDKNGMWKFPQGTKQIDEALQKGDRKLTKAVRDMKTALSDYEWGLFKDDKSKENAIRRAANNALKYRETKAWGKSVKRELELAKKAPTPEAQRKRFDILWNTWKSSTGQSLQAHITGKTIVEIKRRFRMHMQYFPGWSSLTAKEQDEALSVLAESAIRGDFRGRQYHYENELVEVMQEAQKQTSAQNTVQNGATVQEANSMQLFHEVMSDWLAMDKTSKSKYDDFRDYYNRNITRYMRL